MTIALHSPDFTNHSLPKAQTDSLSLNLSPDFETQKMGEDPTTQMSEPTTTTITTSTCSGYSTPPAPIPPPPFPEEVLDNILLFITTPSDRNAVSLVCKSWYRAESVTRTELFIGNCYAVSPLRAIQRFQRIRSVVLKGKPRFADFNLVPPNWGAHFTPWLKPIVSAYPWLEKLCLKRMSVSNVDLILLSCSFPGFKELALVCCEGFGTSGLAALASGCRQLQALDLIDDEVMDEDFDWLSFFPETKTCLESLVFECVECPVNFEALEALVARSPSLKKLRVNQQVCIEQLHRLMAWAPQLTHLGTGSFSSNNPFVQGGQEQELSSAFAACRSLVCLSGFRDIAPEYLLSLRHVCANLISLNFSYAALDTEQLTSVIRHCRKLQNLWVLDSVGDEGLQAVATTCTDLRELRVFPLDVREDGEASVSEVGLLAISQGCRKLQSILYFCQHMTNAAVIAMSNNCPELVVFRLCIMGRQKPDHVTGLPMDEGFGAIVQNCKKLTRLAVSGLLTDRAFSYIGEYGKSVRTLSVAFAGDSDMGLTYVLEGCPKLQKLEIRDSPFGDAALLSGMHHYYNMRFLWMSSCNLSIEGCKDLACRLPNLRVEVIKDREEAPGDVVEKLYMYRSLEGRRDDAPEIVTIL